jgi:hypothetical protein
MFNINKKNKTHFNLKNKKAFKTKDEDLFSFIGFTEWKNIRIPLFNGAKTNSTISLPKDITGMPEKIINFEEWIEKRNKLEPGTIIRYKDVEDVV